MAAYATGRPIATRVSGCRTSTDEWFYAKLMAPCTGLNFAETIGFDTHPLGRFDQFSSIFVPGPGGGRCAVQTFTLSGAPPAIEEFEGCAKYQR